MKMAMLQSVLLNTLTFTTPFRSGHVIDAVLHEEMSSSARDEL
jgi:hypothetical protein